MDIPVNPSDESVPRKPRRDDHDAKDAGSADSAAFIFRGTVLSLDAPPIPGIREAPQHVVVVRVDQVYLAPRPLASYHGQIVTVALRDHEPLQAGRHRTFFTDVWMFGERLVLRSHAHDDPAAAHDALGALTPDPVRNFEDRDIRAHLATTDPVVRGLVLATQLVDVQTDFISQHRSEHDPCWCDARVRVLGTERGTLAQHEITVRYPSSTDVRWYRVHKLQTGMTYVLALHRGADANVFDVLHAEDVHPIQQLSRIRAMIG